MRLITLDEKFRTLFSTTTFKIKCWDQGSYAILNINFLSSTGPFPDIFRTFSRCNIFVCMANPGQIQALYFNIFNTMKRKKLYLTSIQNFENLCHKIWKFILFYFTNKPKNSFFQTRKWPKFFSTMENDQNCFLHFKTAFKTLLDITQHRTVRVMV